jgi:hypothetical protein
MLSLEMPLDYVRDDKFPLALFIKFKSRFVFVSQRGRVPIDLNDLIIDQPLPRFKEAAVIKPKELPDEEFHEVSKVVL